MKKLRNTQLFHLSVHGTRLGSAESRPACSRNTKQCCSAALLLFFGLTSNKPGQFPQNKKNPSEALTLLPLNCTPGENESEPLFVSIEKILKNVNNVGQPYQSKD
jgi:hypothetical protein